MCHCYLEPVLTVWLTSLKISEVDSFEINQFPRTFIKMCRQRRNGKVHLIIYLAGINNKIYFSVWVEAHSNAYFVKKEKKASN